MLSTCKAALYRELLDEFRSSSKPFFMPTNSKFIRQELLDGFRTAVLEMDLDTCKQGVSVTYLLQLPSNLRA
jgi:hypothetical protein